MAQNDAASDDAQNTNVSPVEIEVGQVYETATGVRVEVVEEKRDSKPLVVSKSDREGTERMSRYSFADMVNFENMTLVEDADEDSEGDEDHNVEGEFDGPIPCPECSRFMSTGYDGAGLPVARCSRTGCNGVYDDAELRDRDLWTETTE